MAQSPRTRDEVAVLSTQTSRREDTGTRTYLVYYVMNNIHVFSEGDTKDRRMGSIIPIFLTQ
jgi:hypothetical protein